MTAMLICVGLLILAAGILGGVSANQEREDAEDLHNAIVEATRSAKDHLSNVLEDEMGAAMITARADALGEFIRGMPDIADTERRSKVPFLATVAASILVIGATTVVAIDRIGEHDALHTCIETAAQLALDAPTTKSVVTPTTTPGGAATTPATAATTTAPAPATSGSSGGMTPWPTTTTSPASSTRLAPVAERTAFLSACLRGAGGADDQESDTTTSSTTSSTATPPTTVH